mmetsp:Transcript_57469/g.128312  ORF Transcript_57469/g.128312 Transcript_57469/m.128312 type:complete len:211 (+) Transcript_57469:358-990(+)
MADSHGPRPLVSSGLGVSTSSCTVVRIVLRSTSARPDGMVGSGRVSMTVSGVSSISPRSAADGESSSNHCKRPGRNTKSRRRGFESKCGFTGCLIKKPRVMRGDAACRARASAGPAGMPSRCGSGGAWCVLGGRREARTSSGEYDSPGKSSRTPAAPDAPSTSRGSYGCAPPRSGVLPANAASDAGGGAGLSSMPSGCSSSDRRRAEPGS